MLDKSDVTQLASVELIELQRLVNGEISSRKDRAAAMRQEIAAKNQRLKDKYAEEISELQAEFAKVSVPRLPKEGPPAPKKRGPKKKNP